MGFSQQQYALTRIASASASKPRSGGRVDAISTLRDRTPQPQPEELAEAQAVWGKPSSFSWGSNANDFDQGIKPSTTWEFPENPEGPAPDPDAEDPALAALVDEWVEVERKETEVRIDGPDGAYVDFMRIDEVKFKLPDLPDGREHFVVQKFKTASAETTPGPPGDGSGGSGVTGVVAVGSDGVIRDPAGPGEL
jgi:hypothetical protein